MTEIINNLYLGSQNDARLMTNEVRMVINCSTDIPFYSEALADTILIRLPIEDNGDQRQYKILYDNIEDDEIFKCIDEVLSKNKKVLVHCKHGQQRSCAFVTCFLIWKYNLDIFDAIKYIKTQRKEAFFGSVNFMDAIKYYSKTH